MASAKEDSVGHAQDLRLDCDKDKATLEQARQQLPFILSTAEYDHETRTLTLTSSMDRYYVSEDTPAALAQMHKRLDFRLDDKMHFTRITPRP